MSEEDLISARGELLDARHLDEYVGFIHSWKGYFDLIHSFERTFHKLRNKIKWHIWCICKFIMFKRLLSRILTCRFKMMIRFFGDCIWFFLFGKDFRDLKIANGKSHLHTANLFPCIYMPVWYPRKLTLLIFSFVIFSSRIVFKGPSPMIFSLKSLMSLTASIRVSIPFSWEIFFNYPLYKWLAFHYPLYKLLSTLYLSKQSAWINSNVRTCIDRAIFFQVEGMTEKEIKITQTDF